MIDQSTGQIRFRDESERVVDAGRWISPYTNDIITKASDIDIDHVVPLAYAWDAGAYQMPFEQRVAFANDPINLLAVENSLNRSKGAKGVAEWLPPENECQYVLRFIRILKKYDLEIEDVIYDVQNKECG